MRLILIVLMVVSRLRKKEKIFVRCQKKSIIMSMSSRIMGILKVIYYTARRSLLESDIFSPNLMISSISKEQGHSVKRFEQSAGTCVKLRSISWIMQG